VGSALILVALLDAMPTGQLRLLRPENNGSMNLHPVRVVARARQIGVRRTLGPIIGDEKRCVAVAAGDWVIEASSRHPYRPEVTDDAACQSRPLVVRVKPKRQTIVKVLPASRGSTYVCGWTLEVAPPNDELQRTRDGNAAASPLNSVLCGHQAASERCVG
jgi:hypothetical protein